MMSINDQEDLGFDQEEAAEMLFERNSWVIDKGQEPMRIDKWLVGRLENASRNKVQIAIDNKIRPLFSEKIQSFDK